MEQSHQMCSPSINQTLYIHYSTNEHLNPKFEDKTDTDRIGKATWQNSEGIYNGELPVRAALWEGMGGRGWNNLEVY